MALVSSIPEDFEEGFKQLANLTDNQFQSLISNLDKSEHYPSLSSLSEAIDDEKEFENVDLGEIFASVGNLQTSIDNKDIIDDVIKDVVELSEVLELVEIDKKDALGKRLKTLLEKDKIYYAAKAYDLISNYGNSFIKCKVVSDIRPIFDMASTDVPKAGIILHNLSIHYQSNEEPFHKDISMSLTSYDIKNLKAVLKRAEKKETSLRQLFAKFEMKNLND